MDRRAFLKEAGRSAVAATAAIVASSCDPSGNVKPGFEPPRSFFTSDFSGAGEGWPEPWINVRYAGRWELRNGEGAIVVDRPNPHATNGASHAEYMGQPVILGDREVADSEVSVTLSIEGKAEAGLISRWCYDHAYALLVTEPEIILIRYSTPDGHVMQRGSLPAGRTWRLTLRVDGEHLMGRVDGDGGTEELTVDDPQPLQPGAVGVMVNPTSSQEKGEARFRSFAASSSEEPTPSRDQIAYQFAGGVIPSGGSFRARLTARTVYRQPVGFEVAIDETISDPVVIEPSAPEGKWGSVHAWVNDLDEGREYFWRPFSHRQNGRIVGRIGRFRTPSRGQASRFVFASCTSGRSIDMPSFATAASFDPDFYLHAGDWAYVNLQSLARSPDHWQHRWTRLFRTASVQTLTERSPLMFWQDDHDYQADNGWAKTVDRRAVWAFDEVHANPSDEYFDLRWGDLHIWCLDCRLFATDPKAPDDRSKSRLGTKQKKWLKAGMLASDSPLRVVASPMVFRNKVDDQPGWHNVYKTEREELLSFFSNLNATVLILSGDAHGHRLMHHFEYGELYELTSSGTDWPGRGWAQGNQDPEHTIYDVEDRTGFSVIDLDPPGPERMVSMRAISSLDGETMFEKRLPVTLG